MLSNHQHFFCSRLQDRYHPWLWLFWNSGAHIMEAKKPKVIEMTIWTDQNWHMNTKVWGDVDLSHLDIAQMNAHSLPSLSEPLLSVSTITDTRKAVVFLQNYALIVNNPHKLEQYVRLSGQLLSEGMRRNKLYYTFGHRNVIFRAHATIAESMLPWHRCLSHMSLCSLHDLRRRG